MGGTSSGATFSLASGIRIVQALRGRGHKVIALDPARGVLSAKEELELSTGKVGTEPPLSNRCRKWRRALFTQPHVD